MKNPSHQVNVVRIETILPHVNADKLELIHIGGFQAVSQKGTFKVGDLALYIQPDSVVPQTEPFKFIWEPYLGIDGIVPEKRRRIKAKKLRGEWSEGLLMPISDFSGGLVHEPKLCYGWLKEGDDVSDSLGITHYNPPSGDGGQSGAAPKRKYPKTIKGWFFYILWKLGIGKRAGSKAIEGLDLGLPEYDIQNYKKFIRAFILGEQVIATEKIHGQNFRAVYMDGEMFVGSHYQWKHKDSKCSFRKVLEVQPWIEEFCKAHPGYAIYGELVPTQDGFNYGQTELDVLVFDVLTPEGKWDDTYKQELFYHWVPTLYEGPFDLDKILPLVDGKTMMGVGRGNGDPHIREGIVLKPRTERTVRGLGRLALKMVSNEYLSKS